MVKETDALQEFAEKYMVGTPYTLMYKDGNPYIVENNFLSDLTALISNGYVSKDAYVALENTLAKAEAKNLELLRHRDELKEALAEMIWQFGYRSTYEGRESLHTGGLSALESAFGALGLSDPIALLDFEAAIKNTETK